MSDNLIPVVNDDYLFVKQLTGNNVRLSSFRKVVNATISSEGQNKKVTLKIGTYDFLLKDIQTYAFCQAGNFMPQGSARDLVTLTLKNTSTDDQWVDEGTDIQAFSPANVKATFTPSIIPANTDIVAEFKHVRSVSDTCVDFPRAGTNMNDLLMNFGGGATASNPFPIKIQLVLVGAKIFARR